MRTMRTSLYSFILTLAIFILIGCGESTCTQCGFAAGEAVGVGVGANPQRYSPATADSHGCVTVSAPSSGCGSVVYIGGFSGGEGK